MPGTWQGPDRAGAPPLEHLASLQPECELRLWLSFLDIGLCAASLLYLHDFDLPLFILGYLLGSSVSTPSPTSQERGSIPFNDTITTFDTSTTSYPSLFQVRPRSNFYQLHMTHRYVSTPYFGLHDPFSMRHIHTVC